MGTIQNPQPTLFAPHLTVKNVLDAMNFYKRAFGAVELRRFSNDDGSVHVGEMELDGAMFHLHEETERSGELSPETVKATTSVIGVFMEDPDGFVKKAVAAGAKEANPLQDYDYGYRQATLVDPFGHRWLVEKKI